jgi:hypothetical protein
MAKETGQLIHLEKLHSRAIFGPQNRVFKLTTEKNFLKDPIPTILVPLDRASKTTHSIGWGQVSTASLKKVMIFSKI